MRYRAVEVFLGPHKRRVGLLFQFGAGATATTRLVPDPAYWRDPHAPVLSLAATVQDPAKREVFIAESTLQPFFNGQGERLPAFFQNLLPEGPLRRHLEQLGKLDKDDHFDLLSLCGTDLPGCVYVRPAALDRGSIAAVVTQNNDALEFSVTPVPVAEATSLSGVQPKLALVERGGRYVARTKDAKGVHIIAKLPTVDYPLLPEVEELTLRLARAAGVNTCTATLAELDQIDTEQPFILGEGRKFLAVVRFDRTPEAHIHCEDFAQILDVQPEEKYQHAQASYGTMAKVLATTPALGMPAVEELLRRIVVNDLAGNFDGHLKNFGVIYRDGVTPELSPAYDIVAYSAYLAGRGHALRFTPGGQKHQRVSPKVIRELANMVPGLTEPLAASIVRKTVKLAYETWPDMIATSALLPKQKEQLLAHFYAAPAIASLVRRAGKAAAA